MSSHFRLRICFGYDGTNFSGWQRQKNRSDTVQEILEGALTRICNERIVLTASGRTDAGVHARIQVAHAQVPVGRRAMLNENRMVFAINALLPKEIRVYRADEMPASFDARRGVLKKTYLYFFDASPVQHPAMRHYAWHLRLPINWQLMSAEAKHLKGTHDFKAFCDADAATKTSVRTLYEAKLEHLGPTGLFGASDLYVLRLTGSGFLKHMVRSIAGTLVRIGNLEKPLPGLISEALIARDRALTGPTAPPQGLWLWDLLYRE